MFWNLYVCSRVGITLRATSLVLGTIQDGVEHDMQVIASMICLFLRCANWIERGRGMRRSMVRVRSVFHGGK